VNNQSINLQYTTIKDPLPDFIHQGLATFSNNANAYQPQPAELVQKLADKHHLPSDMIYLTAGIDEALQMFALAYGSQAYTFTPTYVVYADVDELGGKLNRIDSIKNSTFSISPANIPDATLIFLANPNNPSGVTGKDKVIELITNNPQAIVVIDEAYGEFADLSVIDQVTKFPHLAVLRSFSKAYAMAGNRIGYILAHPDIINVVKNKTQWSNVSYLSVGAASIALDHEEFFVSIRQDIGQRRDEFISFLKALGFSLIPSKINAVLIKFSSITEGTRFFQFITDQHFVVSHGNGNSNIGLDESFVRIAIGNANQMEQLQNVIKQYNL